MRVYLIQQFLAEVEFNVTNSKHLSESIITENNIPKQIINTHVNMC